MSGISPDTLMWLIIGGLLLVVLTWAVWATEVDSLGLNLARHGLDVHFTLTLTPQEAAAGRTCQLQVPVPVWCAGCKGAGSKPVSRTLKVTCKDCAGRAGHPVMREFTVKVPPGIESGTRLRLAGAGMAGLDLVGRGNAKPGDVLIQVMIENASA